MIHAQSMAFGAYLELCALDGLGIAVLQSILKSRVMSRSRPDSKSGTKPIRQSHGIKLK